MKKAFTLLELIVVVIILGILAAIAIPSFLKVIHKSKVASIESTLRAVERDSRSLALFDQSVIDQAALQTATGEAPGDYTIAPDASTVSLTKKGVCRELHLTTDGTPGSFSDCAAAAGTTTGGGGGSLDTGAGGGNNPGGSTGGSGSAGGGNNNSSFEQGLSEDSQAETYSGTQRETSREFIVEESSQGELYQEAESTSD